MRRREFVWSLGAAVLPQPIAARAQQGERVRRIGVLQTFASDDPETKPQIAAFERGLAQSGWHDGRNAQIDYRVGAGDAERIRRYAAELIGLAPDVIFAVGTTNVGPLLQTTR